MKLRVHDDIGHSILAVRRALIRRAGLEELRASAALWEQSIAVLYRSNRITASPEPMKVAVRRAAEMGVRVLTEGKPPESRSFCETVSLAIRECAANCARHAGGTELYVRFQPMCGRTEVFLTNNGAAPKGKITEGGGLSMLRHHVEETGGRMEIQSLPRFSLMLTLPEKEETAHESGDR